MASRTKQAGCANRAEVKGAAVEPQPEAKPLRPGQCRAHMRKTLANEFREIVDGFVKQAKSGSCQHVKLATELLEPPRKTSGNRKTTATLNGWLKAVRKPD